MHSSGCDILTKFYWRFFGVSLFILTTNGYTYYTKENFSITPQSYQMLGFSAHGIQSDFSLNEKYYKTQLSAAISVDFMHFIPAGDFFTFALGSSFALGKSKKTAELVQATFYKLPGLMLGVKTAVFDKFNFLFSYSIYWEQYSLLSFPSDPESTDNVFVKRFLFFTPFALSARFGWKASNDWNFDVSVTRAYSLLRLYKSLGKFASSVNKSTLELAFSLVYVL